MRSWRSPQEKRERSETETRRLRPLRIALTCTAASAIRACTTSARNSCRSSKVTLWSSGATPAGGFFSSTREPSDRYVDHVSSTRRPNYGGEGGRGV